MNNFKQFEVSSEFFGGIIRDLEKRTNSSLDPYIFDLYKMLTKSETTNEFLSKHSDSTSKKEILDCIILGFKKGYFNSNIKFYDNRINSNALSAPLRIFYDITYQCNLRCKHCFTKSGSIHPNEMTLEQKFEMVDQISKMHVGRISIAGGEPFISNDLFPFIEKCKKRGLGVSITTNATLLTEDIVKRLNEYNLKSLTVSFDGGTKASMNYIRGEGSYEKTIRGLNNLKQFYINNYSIKTTLLKSNISNLESIVKLAILYGCNNIKFNCVREDGRAQNNNDLMLTQDDYIETIQYLESLKQKYKEKINIKVPLNIFSEEAYYSIKELGFGCFAGKESCCIDPMGNVRPCAHFPEEFICGNILKRPLDEIWRNSSILAQFRSFSGNQKCIECKDYQHCRSGCRYRAYMKGDINQIDPFCYKRLNIINE